jgi:hypothetical protein
VAVWPSPPCDLGMMWSSSTRSSPCWKYSPHHEQRPPCRLSNVAHFGGVSGCLPSRLAQETQAPSYGLRVPVTFGYRRMAVALWRRSCLPSVVLNVP